MAHTDLRNRKFHEILAQQAASIAPNASWGSALAKALQGAIAGGIERGENEQEKSSLLDAITRLGGSSPQFSGTPTPNLATALAQPGPQTQSFRTAGRPVQVIEGNAETQPSPLDPPSGQDRDIAIRTMYGEDPGQSALGVANVIRRRAIDGNFGGNTPSQVALAKGQFEPWANPQARSRMEALQPNSPTYQRLGQTLDHAYKGDDPTGGATHFYAPKAQAQLGRQAPAWDKGPSTTIGPHKFLGGTGAPQAEPPADVQTQLAQGPIPPQMGQPQRPQMTPQQIEQLRALANSGPEGVRRAKAYVQALELKSLEPPKAEEYDISRDPDGTVRYSSKSRPGNIQTFKSPERAQEIIEHEANKDAASVRAKTLAEREIKNALPATSEEATALRKEIRSQPSYKAMAIVAPRYNAMQKAAEIDDRASDLSLTYGFMKILDPESVVRESEVSMAQNIATLPENMRAQVQSFLTGKGRLDPAIRAGILQQAKIGAESWRESFDADVSQFRDIAGRSRINADDVIPSFKPFEEYKPAAKAAPALDAKGQQAAPQGVDPKVWGVMTPQERALWK